jgi:hypothetical protein
MNVRKSVQTEVILLKPEGRQKTKGIQFCSQRFIKDRFLYFECILPLLEINS